MSGIVKHKPKPSFAENQNQNNDQYQVFYIPYIFIFQKFLIANLEIFDFLCIFQLMLVPKACFKQEPFSNAISHGNFHQNLATHPYDPNVNFYALKLLEIEQKLTKAENSLKRSEENQTRIMQENQILRDEIIKVWKIRLFYFSKKFLIIRSSIYLNNMN